MCQTSVAQKGFHPLIYLMVSNNNNNKAIAKLLTALGISAASKYGSSSSSRKKSGKSSKKSTKSRMKSKKSKRKRSKTKRDKKYVSDPSHDYFFKTTYNKPKLAKQIEYSKQLVEISENSSHSIACNGGRQESNIIPDTICGQTILNTVRDKGAQFQLSTSGNTDVVMGGAGFFYNSFYLQEVKSVYRVTNQSPSACEVKLYLLMSKENQTIDPDPISDWNSGLSFTRGGDSAASRAFTDSEPTESYQFNLNWKVVKRISFKIQPGREQKVTWHFEINRLIETGRVNRFISQKGYTFKWMQTLTGGSIGDSANTFATGATVTSVPAKCVGTISNHYKARMCNVFPRIVFKDQDLTAITPSAIPATSVFTIADESGNVVDNAQSNNFA